VAAERNQKTPEYHFVLEHWKDITEALKYVDKSSSMMQWRQYVVRYWYFQVEPVLIRGYLQISWLISSARALTLYFRYATS
jgi:hypothetical protein